MNFVAMLCIVVLIASCSEAKPHGSKHERCSEKVYLTLKELCSFKGHSDYLMSSAAGCCHSNCELTEMQAMCLVAKEVQQADLVASEE